VGRRDDNKAVKQWLAPQEDACKLLMRVLDIRKALKRAEKSQMEVTTGGWEEAVSDRIGSRSHT
jgi:hypothetical protein